MLKWHLSIILAMAGCYSFTDTALYGILTYYNNNYYQSLKVNHWLIFSCCFPLCLSYCVGILIHTGFPRLCLQWWKLLYILLCSFNRWIVIQIAYGHVPVLRICLPTKDSTLPLSKAPQPQTRGFAYGRWLQFQRGCEGMTRKEGSARQGL